MVTVISTFAGCGGSSLGYHWAGFKELLAIDFDQNSCDTFRLNFPDVPCWQRDIKTITAQEILEFCNIKPGELDVLDGSPPCQGFSTAGKRRLNDPRNDLFLDFIRLIEGLQPKVFLMENVSGMIKGGYKGKFNEILRSLRDCGYRVKCKLMNAMWYEVPQSRERVIFIGVRNDLGIEPSYPESLKEFISVEKALKDIDNKTYCKESKNMQELWHKMKIGGDGALGMKCDRSHFNTKKIHPKKPSNTLPKLIMASGSLIMHYSEPRSLTIEEAKRLSSFPDEYIFIGKFEEQWARIGNAVMPKMMYHIAKHIKEKILSEVR
jgi:DNA (cytosine-5)-methyltransferase 1